MWRQPLLERNTAGVEGANTLPPPLSPCQGSPDWRDVCFPDRKQCRQGPCYSACSQRLRLVAHKAGPAVIQLRIYWAIDFTTSRSVSHLGNNKEPFTSLLAKRVNDSGFFSVEKERHERTNVWYKWEAFQYGLLVLHSFPSFINVMVPVLCSLWPR